MKVEIKILNKEFYPMYLSGQGWDKKPIKHYINLPKYATSGSAGIDLVCTKDLTIMPHERAKIPTGIAIWLGSNGYNENQKYGIVPAHDKKFGAFILPRSGLGTKGLGLANFVGVIDEDYQGELTISAWNTLETNISIVGWVGSLGTPISKDGTTKGVYLKHMEIIEPIEEELNKITIKAGEKFAQLVILPVIQAEWQVVEEFSSTTDRGQGGFGSTDK